MAAATFSRGWCTAITSTHEPMLTMEVMVSLMSGGIDQSIIVIALANTGGNLCIMNSTWKKFMHRNVLNISGAKIGLADQSYELKTLGEAKCKIK